MLGEEFGHLGLDRLGQQGARSVAQLLGKRVGERPWLKQLDDVSIGHGVSLLCWRSGGANTPTIRRLHPVSPSPTFAHSSLQERRNLTFISRQNKSIAFLINVKVIMELFKFCRADAMQLCISKQIEHFFAKPSFIWIVIICAHLAVPGWSICSIRLACADDRCRAGEEIGWLGRDR